MNPLLLQQFAQMAGLSPEQGTALQAGKYEVLAESNPVMALMLQQISANQTKAPRPRAEVLDEQLRRVTTVLQYFADVMGACSLCWGNSPNCRICNGKGKPGYRPPREQEFFDLIEPVLQRLEFTAVPTSRLRLVMNGGKQP